MPTLAAQITIGDYAKWRPVPSRQSWPYECACLSRRRQSKELIIWSDAAKAREALNGPEIRSAMQEAGVVGPPKIHVIA
jgi:hypothetical protein